LKYSLKKEKLDLQGNRKYTIREMPASERPRERMEKVGAKNLSDTELIAILLRTGNHDMTALDMAKALLVKFNGLRGLHDASVQALSTVSGVGLAKASQIMAAFEIGKRLAIISKDTNRVVFDDPETVASLMMEELKYMQQEVLRVISLDAKNALIGYDDVAVGVVNGAISHPREIFLSAIKKVATSIIVVHNHTSGDPTPSDEDIQMTKKLVLTGEIVGIPVIDHIIIGNNKYVSLRDFDCFI